MGVIKFVYKLEMAQIHLTHHVIPQRQTGGIKLLGLLMPPMIKSNFIDGALLMNQLQVQCH